MNEREDYLDRLLRGVEDSPEDIQETEEDFLEEFNNSFSEDDENDFLMEFEKSRNKPEEDFAEDRSMDFDMEDIDHIVNNVKQNTMDEPEEMDAFGAPDDFGNLDTFGDFDTFGGEDEPGEVDTLGEGDLPIEESLQNFSDEESNLDEISTDFGDGEQDFMINTMDEGNDESFGMEPLDDMIPEMEEDMAAAPDNEAPKEGDMPMDEMESMAMELSREIDGLGLDEMEEGREAGKKNTEEQEKLDEVLSEEDEEPGKGKKKKKGKKGEKGEKGDEKPGFFKRLSLALFGEEEVEVSEEDKIPEIGDIENISDENIDILRELEGKKGKQEDDAKARKAQKKKEKAEKKAQKKKEREEKKAQKAQEKAAKPKKEKKPKEPKTVIKTKPLPKKPVFLIMLVGVSLVILINLITTQVGYTIDVANAKKYYEQGDYVEAYTCFTQGARVKAADEELYNKAKYTAYVQQQFRNYYMYREQNMHPEALNALICGLGRYDKNVSDAVKAGATAEYDKMLMDLEKLLSENYSMTLEQARTLYAIHEKEDYTYALYDVIDSLGLSESE